MLRKCIVTAITLAVFITSYNCAFGSSRQVTVTLPSFPVALNELRFDNNSYEKYPLLVYKDITYFPMTYYQSNLLNLNTHWTTEDGLIIVRGNPEIPKEFLYETPISNKNSRTQAATVVDANVTVNGKVIDNKNEPYPLLIFRDITYFPLTWRFAVEEFGWNYTFDNTAGLIISADNFFYTSNVRTPSAVFAYAGMNDETYISGIETHYIKGNLRVFIKTDLNRLGPVGWNLYIVENGVETRPRGWFGYFQGKGPLFTVDGNYINTSYYTIPEERNPRPCRVSIETGQII